MIERALIAAMILAVVLLAGWVVRAWNAARVARLTGRAGLEDADHPRLLLFTSAYCDACATQKRIVESLGGMWRGRLAVSYVDAVDDASLARQFGILMVPAVVVAAADGRVVGVKQGLVDEDRLRSMIEAAA